MSRLQGKVAVITGGSSGIGFATAEQFVSEGANVYITGRREKELNAAVAKIGKNIVAVQGDVSNMEECARSMGSFRRDCPNCCLFASDESSYVAGIELFVDGGAVQV